MLSHEQVRRFLNVYAKQKNGRVLCTVCSITLSLKSRPHHDNSHIHKEMALAAGRLLPLKNDVFHCVTCGLSFSLVKLASHVKSEVHRVDETGGKRWKHIIQMLPESWFFMSAQRSERKVSLDHPCDACKRLCATSRALRDHKSVFRH